MKNKMVSDIEHQLKYSKAISQARRKGKHSFQAWFDPSKDIDQSIVRGFWDFNLHILKPKVCEFIEKPEEKRALEIGYGGGRLVNAACGYFKYVVGIDIHDEQEAVSEFLKKQGRSNFELLKSSGKTLDVETESIDFVYSFIVLQHINSFNNYESYLNEAYRCLRPNGVAQLYFGKFDCLNLSDWLRYFSDGFKEIPEAPVNHTSLVVSAWKAKKLCANIGFRVVEMGSSYKRVPDGYPKIKGGQTFITIMKP